MRQFRTGIKWLLGAAGDIAQQISIGSEANPRRQTLADGTEKWGPGGATALDTDLIRDAAKSLALNGHPLFKGKFFRKTADESVSSANTGTTLQNDDHLLVALAANEIWTFEAVLFVTGPGTADIKVGFTVPAGATLLGGVLGPDQSLVDGAATATSYWNTFSASGASLAYGISTGVTTIMVLKGIVVNGATAGNLQLQWAQVVASATNVTVKANSHLVAMRVG